VADRDKVEISHPPYSPDLAPADLFILIKCLQRMNILGRQVHQKCHRRIKCSSFGRLFSARVAKLSEIYKKMCCSQESSL
jgi:hypothetical protein